jgi:hypothetical protein
MKPNELFRFLSGKMHFVHDDKRHNQFWPRLGERVIKLPNSIGIPKGSSGEISDTVFGGVARSLGLREHDLRHAVACRLTRSAVLLCLVSAYVLKSASDPVVYRHPEFTALLTDLIGEAQLVGNPRSWSRAEVEAFGRYQSILQGIAERDARLTALAKTVLSLMVAQG